MAGEQPPGQFRPGELDSADLDPGIEAALLGAARELEWLARRATGADAAQASQAAMPWSVARGRVSIERLRAIERQQGDVAARVAWKAALEDADNTISRYGNTLHGKVLGGTIEARGDVVVLEQQ